MQETIAELDADVLWSGKLPVPAVGDHVSIIQYGQGTVVGYGESDGWLVVYAVPTEQILPGVPNPAIPLIGADLRAVEVNGG